MWKARCRAKSSALTQTKQQQDVAVQLQPFLKLDRRSCNSPSKSPQPSPLFINPNLSKPLWRRTFPVVWAWPLRPLRCPVATSGRAKRFIKAVFKPQLSAAASTSARNRLQGCHVGWCEDVKGGQGMCEHGILSSEDRDVLS